jgi:asparagine synthase (glutamine-hydrolysing)
VEADEGNFDALAREIFASSRLFTPGLANIGMFMPLWRKAAQLGCDSILAADLGNQGFSARGDWSYAGDFGRLAWGRLMGNLRHQDSWDTRGRIVRQRVLSPLLSAQIKLAARRMRRKPDDLGLASMLRPDALSRVLRERPARSSAWHQGQQHMSRPELARSSHTVCDRGAADVLLALREIHGLRYRDATAYRPLLEFCLSLPDEQYLRRGEDRYLARRMGKGLMPEEQRTRKTMARHNIDWSERIGRRQTELIAYAERMGSHPLLAQLVDLERLERQLRDWPGKVGSHAEFMSGWFGVTSAILAGRFLGAIEGRNDL